MSRSEALPVLKLREEMQHSFERQNEEKVCQRGWWCALQRKVIRPPRGTNVYTVYTMLSLDSDVY